MTIPRFASGETFLKEAEDKHSVERLGSAEQDDQEAEETV